MKIQWECCTMAAAVSSGNIGKGIQYSQAPTFLYYGVTLMLRLGSYFQDINEYEVWFSSVWGRVHFCLYRVYSWERSSMHPLRYKPSYVLGPVALDTVLQTHTLCNNINKSTLQRDKCVIGTSDQIPSVSVRALQVCSGIGKFTFFVYVRQEYELFVKSCLEIHLFRCKMGSVCKPSFGKNITATALCWENWNPFFQPMSIVYC